MRARRFRLSAVLLLLVSAVAACSRPSVSEDLRAAIEQYRAGPAEEGDEERIEALFARLDAEVATARADAATESGEARARRTQEADALAAERRDLYAAYVSARFARLGDAAGDALRSAGEAIGEGIEEAGRKLRESSKAPAEESAP